MSKPIFFNGIQYKSKEAMPPEVRIVYEGLTEDRELAELAELEAQENGPDEGMPTAAEGEPLAPGAGPASAAALEAESSLGPASAVFERDGTRRVPNFGTPHASGLVLYRDGFAFQTGKDLHTWRWEEVAAIGSNLTRHDHQKPAAWTEHAYTLTRRSGEKVILDSGIKDIETAVKAIKQAVYARLLPALTQAYTAGQPVSFGAVTIHKQNGLQLDGKLYAWASIMDMVMEAGRFTLTLRDRQRHEARVRDVPNIELLGKLIGRQFFETGLAYY